jgi:ATP-dependent DNA helicase RecG
MIDLTKNIPKKESQTIEFKESTNLCKEGARSIAAFANTEGGELYFGINDNGEIKPNNLFSDSSLKQLANHFQQCIDPNVYYQMVIVELENTNIIKITVEKSQKPIHTVNDILYIRVGTVDQKCDKHELQQRLLKYSGYYNDWSEKICNEATLNELDGEALEYFRIKIIKNYLPKDRFDEFKRMSDEDLLIDFGLIFRKNNKLQISNACLLLFGEKNSSLRLLGRQCRIQYRYSHTGKFDDYSQGGVAPDRGDWRPPFINKFEEIRNQIEKNNHYLAESDLFRNKQIKQYDILTIRELMMNSFVHRDWSNEGFIQIDQTANSLQFENPGEYKFKDLLELVKFPTQSKFYRNRLLADFMFEAGLIEQEASGIKRKIIEKQIERGLPLPNYSIIQSVWTKVFISSKVVNIEFARILLKRTDIDIKNIVLLDRIISGENSYGVDISIEDGLDLKKNKLIELTKGRYQKCKISESIAKLTSSMGKKHTKEKFTCTQEENEVVNFLEKYNHGETRKDFMQLFEYKKYTYDMTFNILRRLKKKGIIYKNNKNQWLLTVS